MRRLGLIALGMCLAACADNAIFELTIDLPMSTGSAPVYAYVQSRSASPIDFTVDWAGADAPEGFLLSTTGTTRQHVSFVTTSSAVMAEPLGVRVRFCSDRTCGAIGDTNAEEAQFLFDRVFYRGKRTTKTVTATPSAMPITPMHFTKCEVAGCTTGTATNYCLMDGRHFCE